MTSIIRAVQEWLNGCPYLTDFTGGQHIDWTDSAPGNYGLAPTGSSVVEVSEDVLGNRTVYKQYNLALYARNWTVDDVIRLENTTFLDDFQQRVEEQQAAGLTPKSATTRTQRKSPPRTACCSSWPRTARQGYIKFRSKLTI